MRVLLLVNLRIDSDVTKMAIEHRLFGIEGGLENNEGAGVELGEDRDGGVDIYGVVVSGSPEVWTMLPRGEEVWILIGFPRPALKELECRRKKSCPFGVTCLPRKQQIYTPPHH